MDLLMSFWRKCTYSLKNSTLRQPYWVSRNQLENREHDDLLYPVPVIKLKGDIFILHKEKQK
jgi:hypothetical protein